MTEQPLIIHSWSKAILHLDADGFFASVEQATNPALKGKPVAVGAERGMATAVSYEAKARGITRGMLMHEIKRLCPEAVLLESDYEKYSLFSVRIFEILRRFSPQVEEYSIDEAFVDLTGLRRVYRCSYGEIGMRIKETIKRELGITVSVGVSLTKVLAKVASKHKKPDGLTVIPGKDVHLYLKELPIEKIWGIGPNTASYCEKLGIRTALDFARKSESFIKRYFTKPHQEIWHELNGRSVYPVVTEPKSKYKSISKVKTFTPTTDRNAVYGHLIENIDNAFFKARRYGLSTKRVVVFIKRQDYRDRACEIVLTEYTSYPEVLFPHVREAFSSIYEEGVKYRQTGVILLELTTLRQGSLFSNHAKVEKIEKLYNVVDSLKVRLGRSILVHAPVLLKHDRSESKQNPGIPIVAIEV